VGGLIGCIGFTRWQQRCLISHCEHSTWIWRFRLARHSLVI
jgi:hypothetical protein